MTKSTRYKLNGDYTHGSREKRNGLEIPFLRFSKTGENPRTT